MLTGAQQHAADRFAKSLLDSVPDPGHSWAQQRASH
jgi:hypothetical protein